MFADFGRDASEAIELSREAGEFELQPYPQEDGDTLIVVNDAAPPDDATSPYESSVTGEGLTGDRASSDDEAYPLGDDGSNAQHPTTPEDVIEPDGSSAASSEAYERGRAEARRELVEVQRQLEERYSLLWEDMQTQLSEAERLYEARAVELALLVAKRLVGSVVESNRGYVHQVIQDAMKAAVGTEISAVRVSPQDYAFLALDQYSESNKIISGKALTFVSDESIRAGCILVTSAGEVDFNLDTLWNQIHSKIVQEPST